MDPFVGEIRLMPYSFAPRGWQLCDGSLLQIRQNTALFSLLGTRYGGDGQNTFAIPDLRGRAAVGMGQGPGLTNYPQGTKAGTEAVTLQLQQMPAHIHSMTGSATLPASTGSGAKSTPTGNYFAKEPVEQYGQAANGGNTKPMLNGTTSAAGGGQPHENRMPFLVMNYCIALQGVFPQRQ